MEAKYDPIYSEERQMVSAVHRWDESKEHVERETGKEHPSHLGHGAEWWNGEISKEGKDYISEGNAGQEDPYTYLDMAVE